MQTTRGEFALALVVILSGCSNLLPFTPGQGSGDLTRDGQRPDGQPRDGQPRDGPPHDGPPLRDARAGEQATDAGCRQWILSITTPGNDVEISQSTFYVNGESGTSVSPAGIYIGNWSGQPTLAAFRFQLTEALPPGAKMKAYLHLVGSYRSELWDPAKHALQIALEDTNSAEQVTDAAASPLATSSTHVLLQTHLRWPASGGLAWPQATEQKMTSPDLAPLFNALLAKRSLAKDAWVQLWLWGTVTYPGDAEVAAFDFMNDTSKVARLELSSCP